jgi:hypothetical protein
VAFFEGFQSLIKKKKPKKKASPTLTTQSQNINMERRLKAAGAKVPEHKKKGNWFTKLMKALDHPANIVRTGATAYYKTGSKQKAIKAAKSARDKGVYTPGTKLLETMSKRGAPLAKWATKTPIRKAVSGFATDVLLDPLTYTTVGTRRVAMGIPELSKTISKEIAKETGKKLSRKSAERLAKNAVKGQIPTGRMGTAIERSLGRKAETKGVPTGYGKLSATEKKIELGKQAIGKRQSMAELAKKAEDLKQGKLPKSGALPPGKPSPDFIAGAEGIRKPKPLKVTNIEARKLGRQLAKPYEQEAKGFARAAVELEKQAEKIKPKQGFAAVTEAAGKPGRDVTAIRFMGQDIVDITPIAKPVRTALGAVIEASPTLTKLTDRLGRTFAFNYTPKGTRGLERELVTGAKERVTQTMREVPYVRGKALKETLEKWKGVGKEAAEEAPGIIEKTSGFASVAGRQAAEKAAKLFDYDVQRFAKEGIPLDVVDNYVQHIYKDPPEKVRQILAAWRQKSQVTGARPSFTKQRSIPTLAQAEAMGLHPIKDVRQLTMVHRALTEQAVTINRMGKDLIRMGDMIVRKTDPGGWVNVTHTAIPALQGKYVHPEVAKALDNLLPVATNTDEGMRTLMGAIDGLTSAWKGVVLFRPSFHARNAIGNVFLNIADGMMNPGRYAQALAVYSGVLPHVNLAGKRVPSSAVLDWFEREALKGQGMFRESLHGRTKGVTEQAARMINALEKRGYNVRYYLRHPFEASREFGEATDSIGRLANFLHHLDSGKPIKEAAQRTRLALFDYGALTNAERKIRSSIMPFYTWVRFAFPRMCEKLVGAPGLFTGSSHLRENMVRYNEIDEQNMPEWLEEMQAIPLWVDPQGNVHYMTWNLPLTELTKIKEPGDIKNIAEEVAMMMNPLMTVPVQLASNRQVMGGMPITQFEDLGGKHMLKDYGKWAISQLGMPAEIAKAQREAQMHREYQEAVDKGEAPEIEPSRKSPFERVLQFTSVQNPASWQRQALYKRNRQLQQAIKAAEQDGIKVPSTEEIGRPGEKKGFAKVVEGQYGKGFSGVAAKGVAKDVGSVPDAISQAIQLTGVDASWGPYMKLLLQAESGGNPMARNPIWVNYRTGQQARGGRPGPGWYQATGLYQMMEPTFRSYAAPGHDDIYNPLDNTIASINYIKSRYGHPANIPRLGQPGYRGY